MSDERHPVPEMDAFREQLRAAAAREQEAPAQPAQDSARRRRRRRFGGRGLGVAVAALLVGGGAVAVGTSVISVGEPESFPTDVLPGETPDVPREGTTHRIVVRAPDPAQRLQWGVGVAAGADGDTCLIAGQVRGDRLGLVAGDEFRPYPADTNNYCTKRAPDGKVRAADLLVRTKTPRLLVFGTAGRDVRRVEFEVDGDERVSATPSPEGVFLVVLEAGARRTGGPDTFDARGRPLICSDRPRGRC